MPRKTTSSPDASGDLDPKDRYRYWPDLSFYYGLGWDELRRMPKWLCSLYIEELPRLRAQAQLAAIDSSSFSDMEEGARKRLLRRLNREAGVGPAQASPQSIAASGIGVKMVPAEDGEGGD